MNFDISEQHWRAVCGFLNLNHKKYKSFEHVEFRQIIQHVCCNRNGNYYYKAPCWTQDSLQCFAVFVQQRWAAGKILQRHDDFRVQYFPVHDDLLLLTIQDLFFQCLMADTADLNATFIFIDVFDTSFYKTADPLIILVERILNHRTTHVSQRDLLIIKRILHRIDPQRLTWTSVFGETVTILDTLFWRMCNNFRIHKWRRDDEGASVFRLVVEVFDIFISHSSLDGTGWDIENFDHNDAYLPWLIKMEFDCMLAAKHQQIQEYRSYFSRCVCNGSNLIDDLTGIVACYNFAQPPGNQNTD